MRKTIRNAVLLGLGGYQYAKEGITKLVGDLEKEGKMTPEEGKKLIDDIVKQGKNQSEKQYGNIKETIQNIVNEMGLATKKEVEELRKELNKK